jgi:hypothetical protein
MRTSDIIALAVALLFPVVVTTGCLDGSTCLRTSDCPAADICSVGACILAPVDSEGGTDEGGAETGIITPDAATPADTGTGVDATLSDAGTDADADADGASDAGDGATTDGAPLDDASDATTE